MKKIIIIILCLFIIALIVLSSCSQSLSNKELTQQQAAKIIKEQYAEEIADYRQSLALPDLDLEIEFTEYKDAESYCSANIRPYIVCPSVDDMFVSGNYDNEVISKLATIKLDFGIFDYKEKEFILYPAYSDPVIKTSSGKKYYISEGTILEYPSFVVVYQTPEDQEKYPNLSVGTQVGDSSSYNSGNSSSRQKCSYCNGTGKRVVEFYEYGDWGEKTYSSYTCSYCNGTGYAG